MFPVSFISATCPTCPVLFHLMTLTLVGEEYRLITHTSKYKIFVSCLSVVDRDHMWYNT